MKCIKYFIGIKNDEWERFLGATTQWDLDTYLDLSTVGLKKINKRGKIYVWDSWINS